MAMNKDLHSRNDIAKLYVSREGGRGIASVKDIVDTSIRRLVDYIEKSKETFTIVTRNDTNSTMLNRTIISRKQKWEEKQLYGYFKRQTGEISHEKTWTWLRRGNVKREIESLLRAA